MPSPLEGIAVVDLSRGGPGPYCTMVLGDLGAEVVQVTEPGRGRGNRPGAGGAASESEERNAAFNPLLRNKKSIGLNLRQPQALKVLHRLVEKTDVLVEGFRPGVAQRLGIDYPSLKRTNSRLVYCSITGYGQDGPYREVGGHDINYLSTAGALVEVQKQDDGRITATNLVGLFTGRGMVAAVGILAALMARERTGQGQFVDIGLADTTLYLLAPLIARYLEGGSLPSRGEPDLTGRNPYYAMYETGDGQLLSVACGEPHIFDALMSAVGKEEWVGRQGDRSLYPAMAAYLRETFRTRPGDEWFDYLQGNGVSVARVNDFSGMVDDPQVVHRGMVLEAGRMNGHPIRHIGVGPKLSLTPGSVRSVGAVDGSHTLEVLRGLGYSHQELEEMRATGAI